MMRKITAAFVPLLTALTCSANVFAGQAADSAGDVSGDGVIAADDAQLLLSQYVRQLAQKPVTLSDAQIRRSHVTGSEVRARYVSAADAQTILCCYVRQLAGMPGEPSEYFEKAAEKYRDRRLTEDLPSAYTQLSDYTAWAKETGYPGGLLTPMGVNGINQDYFRTPEASAGYRSGRIIVGDSRCCQLGIAQERANRGDFAVFAVWGGHFAGESAGTMTELLWEDMVQCFRTQIESCGKSVICLFASVNDFDFISGQNDSKIADTVRTAERIAALSYEYGGKICHPEVIVVGFDGGQTDAPVIGYDPAVFNRYVPAYNEALYKAVCESSLLSGNAGSYTDVPSVTCGRTDFIADGLHYGDSTLSAVTAFIIQADDFT